MIFFFCNAGRYYAVESPSLSQEDIRRLSWLFGGAEYLDVRRLEGHFLGRRPEMISPWSTNAVAIVRNMGIPQVTRIETFLDVTGRQVSFDPMLETVIHNIDIHLFDTTHRPAPIRYIEDIAGYNRQEGLALSEVEIEYLQQVSRQLGRKLTDSEVFGFSQINSEHCRHKIFNGIFIIDGKTMPRSLFALIKHTTKSNPNSVVSAYKDNVAFIEGPTVEIFAPTAPERPSPYRSYPVKSVISLKAETHNFPTTVEAFNGAATGSGGEIRDRMAGGKAGIPLAGTAVYMTPYARISPPGNDDRPWEKIPPREWLYQTPAEILIKASDGASDFGNKFGQPLICGSLFTFEYSDGERTTAYDKVIMLAGGTGYAKYRDARKDSPQPGDLILVMGGDNYRIGMGGAAVSSADTGQGEKTWELNAIQRSNPEMQKRVANVIRAMAESARNPILSIHDHGAGGHLNCLTELVEDTGGVIDIDKLPLGDPGLSYKEILGNESQERMGLVVSPADLPTLLQIARRERAPLYVVGQVTGDGHFKAYSSSSGQIAVDMSMMQLFGNTPVLKIQGENHDKNHPPLKYDENLFEEYLSHVLRLEAVASKDWLTNKVDRCVSGRVAKQQTCGEVQLPLNDVAVVALDYRGIHGIATSVGHAPAAGLLDPAAGARLSVAEALTNIIWAPLEQGLKSVSLSANWMWPAGSPEENARLYRAVEALSEFVTALGINVPTGKDSLSMTQRYPGGEVKAPGTVIISAAAHCHDIKKTVEPVIKPDVPGALYYLNFSDTAYHLGGSSFAQTLGTTGDIPPDVTQPGRFATAFNAVQKAITRDLVIAGHDISAGGMLTALLEMCFPATGTGAEVRLDETGESDVIRLLFAENPGVIIQARKEIEKLFDEEGVEYLKIGKAVPHESLHIHLKDSEWEFSIPRYREIWSETSYLFDKIQRGERHATLRYRNISRQVLRYTFPQGFDGKIPSLPAGGFKPVAGVLREQGSNSEREMAYALHLAGFEVRDIHMSDIIEGREDLAEIDFLVAVGGFSYSDVLGSAKGWAGSFLFNEKAKKALDGFYRRDDTLSLGVCNGCQLFVELGVLTPEHEQQPRMEHNDSGKFECLFTSVTITPNHTVMLAGMEGSTLGIWAAHGEGKFSFPYPENRYHIPGKYAYGEYPANPNGSDYNAAMLASGDGRHLAMMPHLERSVFPWNWAYYPGDRKNDAVSPWLQAFVNAYEWFNKKR